MMNRRLRERLTEADILQIFIDVCEGVAAMHHLRPALLHRDLKVENILQSSDTQYKLCDFGSAAPVASRLPANTQEIRAVEADLNRHTTLQYRAPEMVDPYLRRPIDEKSDVWALGVLLYKLCYYTTPFEEHGPLAILNVQYKIPPYPVYSAQMNSLIGMSSIASGLINAHSSFSASMLREHGSQRPTVFEILNLVHRMRGTKSKFAYNVPSRSQLVPRLVTEPASTTAGALDGLVSYRSSTSSVSQAQMPSSNKNAGVQAREKVLEAIAPLRRGRPTPISLHHATTGPSSPMQEKVERKSTELDFNDAEDESWKAARGAVRGHRSGLVSPTKWSLPAASYDDAWSVARGLNTDAEKAKNRDRRKTVMGSQGDLSGFGDSFGGGLELPSAIVKPSTSSSGTPWLTPQLSVKPPETTSRIRAPDKPKDAFEGLGLPSGRAPVPTLGEVQKARTGASVGATGVESSTNLAVPGRGTSHSSASNSPRPSPSPRLSSQAPSPGPPVSTSWRPSPSPLPQAPVSAPKVDLSVEQRFPALEDLDSSLLSRSPPRTQPQSQKMSPLLTSPALPPRSPSSAFTGTSSLPSGRKFAQGLSRGGGIHSEQTTGTAPLESREERTPKHERTGSHLPTLSPSRIPRLPSRTMPPRRQSSLTVLRTPPASKGPKPNEPPSPAQIMGRPEPQDWLTGPEEDPISGSPTKVMLKESPGKRTSVIVERSPHIPSPQEAVAVSEKRASPPPSPTPAPRTTSSWIMAMRQANVDTGSDRPLVQPKSRLDSSGPRVSAPPPADSWLPTHRRRDTTSTTSSDDGPEDATGYGPQRLAATRMPMRIEAKDTGGANRRRRSKSKSRQSSVHELVDLWGGKEGRTKPSGKGSPTVSKIMSQEPDDTSSSSKPLLFPPTGQSSKPRSASPSPLISPLISPSISNDSTRLDLSTSTQSSSRHRKQSTNGRDAGPPPSTSAGSAIARPRPQSMFLNSPTTAAVKFPMASQVDSSSASLDVPSPDPRSRRTARRTSISDMVQRYEAMGSGSGAPSPVSRQPTSSAPTGVSLARSATTHVSPSPRRGHLSAVGLPGLATDPSKKPPPTGLGVSDNKPRAERASPVGLPGLAMERKPSASYGSGRRSPAKQPDVATTGGGGGLDIPVRPVTIRSVSPVNTPAGEEASTTATTEKPYQGVGRLIDQWQRKTADAEAPRSPVSRRKGGGGGGEGGEGTGATASPRRAGVIAGRGAQD